MQHCHSHGIVHRDLKLENIMVDDRDTLWLIDFGLGQRHHAGSFLDTHCGTYEYAAPEMLNKRPYTGPPADVWSLGVIVFVLTTGRYPFSDDEQNAKKLKEIIDQGHAVVTFPPAMSPSLISLIRGILVADPERRFTVSDILEHEWLQADDGAGAGTAMARRGSVDALDEVEAETPDLDFWGEFQWDASPEKGAAAGAPTTAPNVGGVSGRGDAATAGAMTNAAKVMVDSATVDAVITGTATGSRSRGNSDAQRVMKTSASDHLASTSAAAAGATADGQALDVARSSDAAVSPLSPAERRREQRAAEREQRALAREQRRAERTAKGAGGTGAAAAAATTDASERIKSKASVPPIKAASSPVMTTTGVGHRTTSAQDRAHAAAAEALAEKKKARAKAAAETAAVAAETTAEAADRGSAAIDGPSEKERLRRFSKGTRQATKSDSVLDVSGGSLMAEFDLEWSRVKAQVTGLSGSDAEASTTAPGGGESDGVREDRVGGATVLKGKGSSATAQSDEAVPSPARKMLGDIPRSRRRSKDDSELPSMGDLGLEGYAFAS